MFIKFDSLIDFQRTSIHVSFQKIKPQCFCGMCTLANVLLSGQLRSDENTQVWHGMICENSPSSLLRFSSRCWNRAVVICQHSDQRGQGLTVFVSVHRTRAIWGLGPHAPDMNNILADLVLCSMVILKQNCCQKVSEVVKAKREKLVY